MLSHFQCCRYHLSLMQSSSLHIICMFRLIQNTGLFTQNTNCNIVIIKRHTSIKAWAKIAEKKTSHDPDPSISAAVGIHSSKSSDSAGTRPIMHLVQSNRSSAGFFLSHAEPVPPCSLRCAINVSRFPNIGAGPRFWEQQNIQPKLPAVPSLFSSTGLGDLYGAWCFARKTQRYLFPLGPCR